MIKVTVDVLIFVSLYFASFTSDLQFAPLFIFISFRIKTYSFSFSYFRTHTFHCFVFETLLILFSGFVPTVPNNRVYQPSLPEQPTPNSQVNDTCITISVFRDLQCTLPSLILCSCQWLAIGLVGQYEI